MTIGDYNDYCECSEDLHKNEKKKAATLGQQLTDFMVIWHLYNWDEQRATELISHVKFILDCDLELEM